MRCRKTVPIIVPCLPIPLSQHLRQLLDETGQHTITIGRIIELLSDRGYDLLLLLLCLPFILPIPTVGLSSPIGIAIIIHGICLCLGLRPWLPAFIRRRKISRPTLEKTVAAAQRILSRCQRLLRPRLAFMHWPAAKVVVGLALITCGLILSLPLPLPFTNAIPAAGILLLLAGMLERDGAFILAGLTVTAASILMLVMVWEVTLGAVAMVVALVT